MGAGNIKSRQLVVRCVAFRENGQWVGVCLNYNLAAQGESFNAVRGLLDAQIRSYIREALVGPDRDHAEYLLTRRAPIKYWAMYGLCRLAHRLNLQLRAKEYTSPLSLVPA